MTGKAVAFPRLFKKGWGKNGPEQRIKSIKFNGRKRRSTDDRIRPGSDFLPDRKVDLPGRKTPGAVPECEWKPQDDHQQTVPAGDRSWRRYHLL